MKKISLIVAIISVLSLILTSCSSQSKDIDIIYPFGGEITSYDPQIATTGDEFLIVENCFEGLIRIDDNGKISSGAATDWSVSEDGLTYTFTLRQDAVWYATDSVKEMLGLDTSDESKDEYAPKVTASDFVFAFQRAVDPTTNCPLYANFSNIQGAADINKGKKSVNTLGVSAPDDYTFVVKLVSPDSKYLSTLASSAAMPCNKEFFEMTNGRYGLGAAYTIYNGEFYVGNHLETSYILNKNDEYKGTVNTKVSNITLNIVKSLTETETTSSANTDNTTTSTTSPSSNKQQDVVQNLESGYYDAAYLTSSQYNTLDKDSGVTTIPYSNITWSFLVNCESGSLAQKDLRKGLCLALSEPDFSSREYYSKATQIVPPACIADASKDVDISLKQNLTAAADSWKTGLKKTDDSVITITLLTSKSMEDMAKELVQGIQGSMGRITTYGEESNISFSLKIETVSDSELMSRVSSGNYDTALYPIKASSDNGASYINEIITSNPSNMSSKELTKSVNELNTSNADNQQSALVNCQQQIINTYSIIPVFYEYSYYAMAKGVSNIQFHPGSGRVSFINATREK